MRYGLHISIEYRRRCRDCNSGASIPIENAAVPWSDAAALNHDNGAAATAIEYLCQRSQLWAPQQAASPTTETPRALHSCLLITTTTGT